MAIQTRLVTSDDLLSMPDDGYRYELVKGELRKMSPSGHKHGQIAVRLTWRLAQHVEAQHLGVVYAAETGFRLATNPDTVRAPDVAFVRRERVEAAGDVEGFWPGAPDVAVEVLSPRDTYTEVEEKVVEWLHGGTRLVIVIDPRKRTVTVYRALNDITILTEADVLDGDDVIPDWSMPIRELFV
jgi:Uma2 family endonuclease